MRMPVMSRMTHVHWFSTELGSQALTLLVANNRYLYLVLWVKVSEDAVYIRDIFYGFAVHAHDDIADSKAGPRGRSFLREPCDEHSFIGRRPKGRS